MKRPSIGVLACGLACSTSDATGSATGSDWEVEVRLDPCGFADPPLAQLDISEQRDVFHGAAFMRVEGAVFSAPPLELHHVEMTEGACRYLEPVPGGTCDPPCKAGELCGTDNVCAPAPPGASAGLLTIKGLGEPIDVEPASFSPGTYYGPTDLAAPAFSAQDEIGARFEGGDFPMATLGARGVVTIDATLVTSGFEMVDGGDAQIEWTPGPDPDACIRVVLNGSNVVHGAPLDDIIECEGPDTGSLVIPRSLVEAFPIGETPELTEGFDWPHSELTRYSRSREDTDGGPAQLVVRSTAYFPVRHPG